MHRLLLKNPLLFTPESIIRKDLLVEGNFIAKIDDSISADGADTVLDCHELLVIPGLIDEHVHFREPGMESKGTIKSESRAAVLGGVTSYLDMPNNNPPTCTLHEIYDKKQGRQPLFCHFLASLSTLSRCTRIRRRRVPSRRRCCGRR